MVVWKDISNLKEIRLTSEMPTGRVSVWDRVSVCLSRRGWEIVLSKTGIQATLFQAIYENVCTVDLY